MARQVLVLHGKHGNEYFDVPDSTALDDVALKILTERFNQGYWYDEDYELYAAIKLCVENQRAVDAFFLLRRRSEEGYEYERIGLSILH
jgi:hypothetical protein